MTTKSSDKVDGASVEEGATLLVQAILDSYGLGTEKKQCKLEQEAFRLQKEGVELDPVHDVALLAGVISYLRERRAAWENLQADIEQMRDDAQEQYDIATQAGDERLQMLRSAEKSAFVSALIALKRRQGES